MHINRKQFLGVAAGSGAGLVLAACGGGGYGGGTPASSCGSTIAGNHGHTLPIAVADLNSAVDKSYAITGTADHAHTVTLTPAQLAQLKAGTQVGITSTAGGPDSHTHAVAVTCTIY